MESSRRYAPATLRNREPLLAILARVLPPLPDRAVRVLEVASGSGEHAVWFGSQLPHVEWQPSDADADARLSIDAWRDHEAVSNVRPAIELDATSEHWPVHEADAVVCINMIHIAPPAAGHGLLRGAAAILPSGAPLILYGPFQVHGAHTAPSNAEFDASLRARNPTWGVRNLDDVLDAAKTLGFAHDETIAMPANNLTVILRRV